MNKGYTIKDSKAIITDTKGNLKEIEYYDRLDETLVQENIVEAMENVISKLNETLTKYDGIKKFFPTGTLVAGSLFALSPAKV